MSHFFRFSFTLIALQSFLLFAQPNKFMTNKDSYNWMAGASWLLLDDDGNGTNPFNFSDYHSAVYPTRAFFDKYIYDGWSVEGSVSFQKYDNTKLVNDSLGIDGKLFAFDVHSKYSFYKFLGKSWIDPYIIAGGGITTRDLDSRNTAKAMSINANIGGGINFWVSYNVGIQIQTVAKFSLNDFMGPSNHMAHTAGFVVRIDNASGGESGEFSKSKYKIKKGRTKIKLPKGNKKNSES
jgi:hypothetical protein